MENRILLPTDYSKNSRNAIEFALALYKNVPCKFYLLNAFHASGYSLDSLMVAEPGEKHYEAARARSMEGMGKLLASLQSPSRDPLHSLEPLNAFNSLLVAVEEAIKAKDIDIIVMGTKGLTDSSSTLFGTNAVVVMERVTQCPVIGVPSAYSFSPPREIVFPTDYNTAFRRRELNYMLEIAKLHGAAIRVLHIEKEAELNRGQESNKALLKEILDGVEFSFHTLRNVNVRQGIKVFIESRQSDMVAFQNRKHYFFSSILSHPLVKEIGFYSNIPMLVLQDQS